MYKRETVLPGKVRVPVEVPPLNYIRVLRSAIEQRGPFPVVD